MKLSSLESRMAWHGGLYRHGQMLCTPEQLEAWRSRLPSWLEEEHSRLDSGELPSRSTLRALLDPPPRQSQRGPSSCPRPAPAVEIMGAALDDPKDPKDAMIVRETHRR